jgi:8-oxo-dGTP pyrophosphatase MutT (NUDIX family)
MAHHERTFERIGSETLLKGRIVTVTNDTFRYADGKTSQREIVHTAGAVGMVAIDEDAIWLVRQPREPVGDPDSLEIPAGRLDRDGETPLECAQRELAEEIGKAADRWTPLRSYRSSVGFTDEVVHLFLAEGLHDADGEHDSGVEERIEIVQWPLARLAAAINEVSDAKSLIGLLLLERQRAGR